MPHQTQHWPNEPSRWRRKMGSSPKSRFQTPGRGVSEEVAKKIFDPFFSTKEHGMGMGLSIVRTIVTAHGGQIDFENRNGANGAVFRVKLPLGDD